MKKIWTHVLTGATALLCATAAQAYVIDFEQLDTSAAPFAPLLADGDYVGQGGYVVQAEDSNNTGPFNGSLVGQLMNGSDPGTCLDGSCSTGNTTHYMSALNNGLLYMAGPSSITLSSFDAAFLPSSGSALPSGTVALLGFEADRADSSYAVGIFNLAGPSATTGLTSFAHYAAANATIIGGTGTLTSGNVVDLYVFAYYCGTSSNCTPFAGNKVQFAIDNIAVNVPAAVPEPSEWALMALGLGAVGSVVRRRRSV